MCCKRASKSRCFHKSRGFSTIELVVTVGLLAAIAAIAVPAMSGLRSSYNSRQAASNIVSQMQLARVHAIKNHVTTVVVFYPQDYVPSAQANSYLIYEDRNNNWVRDSGENFLTPRTQMPARMNLKSAIFTANGSGEATATTSCGFDSQGIAARTGATYVVGNVVLENPKAQTRTISFNATGKTRMSQP